MNPYEIINVTSAYLIFIIIAALFLKILKDTLKLDIIVAIIIIFDLWSTIMQGKNLGFWHFAALIAIALLIFQKVRNNKKEKQSNKQTPEG